MGIIPPNRICQIKSQGSNVCPLKISKVVLCRAYQAIRECLPKIPVWFAEVLSLVPNTSSWIGRIFADKIILYLTST